jgi:hypothetical protein
MLISLNNVPQISRQTVVEFNPRAVRIIFLVNKVALAPWELAEGK